MPSFAFKSNDHFVGSSDGTTLQVYKLTKPINHLSSVHKFDWEEVATIVHTNPQEEEEEDDDDIDPKALSYGGLLFFDGHGRIEGEEALAMLAKQLKELHLRVSPEGYCFQQVFDIGVYSAYGIHYLWLNDLFSWPSHGVYLVTINVWTRFELNYYNLPKHTNTSNQPVVGGGGVSKEKYADLERSVKEKDEELEKLKNEMDEAKIERATEIKKLKEEMEIKNRALLDEELQKLRREKAKELVVVSGKLSYSEAEVAKVKKELEECQRKSWGILPSTMFLPRSLNSKDKYLAIRQRVPPETFQLRSQVSFPYVSNSRKLADKMRVDAEYKVTFVDEDNSHNEWPPLPTIIVFAGTAIDVDFDKNDWWYLKTTHPEGGLTMLVYYEGNRSQISKYSSDGDASFIPLPFSKDTLEVFTFDHMFSLFRMDPFGVRIGFAYRPRL